MTKTMSSTKIVFGLREKLFIFVLISFSIFVIAIVGQIGLVSRRVAGQEVTQSLSRMQRILQTRLSSSFERIEDTAWSLSKDSNIVPHIYFEDLTTLKDLSQEAQQQQAFDILMITNAEGKILARNDRERSVGSFATKSKLITTALEGSVAKGFMRKKGGLLQIVAVPVFDNIAPDLVKGVVAVAYRLSDGLADEIKDLTASEMAIYVFESDPKDRAKVMPMLQYGTIGTLSSKLTEFFWAKPHIWEPLSRGETVGSSNVELGDQEFSTLYFPLTAFDMTTVGFVVGMRSRTEILAPFSFIRSVTLHVGLVCILLSGLIARVIAGKLAGLITNLIPVTEAIQEGNYPDPVESHRTDEVGQLYDAVYKLGQELKAKSELEDYLASISQVDEASQDSFLTVQVEAKHGPVKTGTMELHPDVKLEEGQIFDRRYRVEGMLGKGGAAVVYRAYDLDLQEHVALKLFRRKGLTEQALENLRTEIKLARQISHPNVVRTHDFGSTDTAIYISMECVPGNTLFRVLAEKGALPFRMGVLLARQICSAVGAAHREGVIHRDLKPENIMITSRGMLKIMDFGVAQKTLREFEGGEESAQKTGLDNKRFLVGTPAYMSPEQFKDVDLDYRTDIYSIGIILFYMFAGDLPFQGTTFEDMAIKHLMRPAPSISAVRAEVPPEIEEVILACLQKEPTDRYESVDELGRALRGIAA